MVTVAICGIAAMAGCDHGPQVVPVNGTVTYNGEPLKDGGITFAPPDARAAFGRVVDGKIVEVTTFEAGDGAITGPVKVGIQATTNLGKMTGPHDPLIPRRYFDPATSGLSVEIKADEPNEFNFELQSD